MALYITYHDYSALFPDRLTEDEFKRLLPSGAAFIGAITAGRAESATGYKAERAEQALAAVITEMAAQNAARGDGGSRVTSVSNDGYTENYGSHATAAAEEAALRSIAFRYLSGTGLVSAL